MPPIEPEDGEDIDETGDEPEDDRHEALNWYLRRRILQEIERGIPAAELARRSGMKKPQLTNIKNDARNAGLKTLIRMARPVFHQSEGSMLDDALVWWEKVGRREKAQELARRSRAAEAKVEQAIRRKPSGERPSVRLRAGLPVQPSPPPAPPRQQKK